MFRVVAAVVLLTAFPVLARSVFVSFDDRARLGGPLRSQVQQAVLQSAAAADEQDEVRDISELSRALFAPGMLVPGFDKPPPRGWPKSLAKDWEQGNAGCRARIEKVGRIAKPAAAMQCQKELARALYERFLDHERPALVLEVSTLDAPGDDQGRTVRVFARIFTPSGEHSEGRKLLVTVPRADTASSAARLVTSLRKGEGESVRIELPRALPQPPPAEVKRRTAP